MKTAIISLIMSIAPHFDIDPNLAVAVAKQESSLRPNVIGSVGEVGLFQIRPEYSKFDRKELLNPIINIVEGLRFLRNAKKTCRHQSDNTWIICYNRGVTGGSKVKKPKLNEYYLKVMSKL